MHLNQYLQLNRITQAEFGRRLKPPVSQGCIGNWLHGRREINLHRAIQIEQITGGSVTPKDCMELRQVLSLCE
ncbi:Putative transcriptional regulator [Mycoavidus cysteinexigens]|uniref:Transcriptional regulator n=1 Tax=Mycoavidus cysteinexigens TaxID=1553431 RepID=A0A2Z6EW61_9BURK|nr:YdaS family helix-turn-helix protein [Mycoavidus cysteinexigens]BBE09700.1 Putative transcriptional regulator [Mycoavidus cysteinexigens]GLR01678.1 hypothetical protein GCM10007934_14900 [Mycoavidus cysteinexigens]